MNVRGFLFSLTCAILGLIVSLVISFFIGENPLHVLNVMTAGAFGSWTNIGYTFYYATPLMFTGFAVSWALRTGLFNIGAEGQMVMGAMAATVLTLSLPEIPSPLSWLLVLIVASFAGGLWGALAGWLKAYRGAHEVLATILLNIVAAGITGYVVNHLYKNPTSQNPETLPFTENFLISTIPWLGGQSPLNWSFVFALILIVFFSLVNHYTILGFRSRLTGDSPGLALHAGVDVKKQILLAMAISGAFAGLAGISEVFSYSGKLKEGFAAGAGFTGIAVALLGRHHPVGIIASAFLFGALHKGSLDLDIDTEYISRDFALVIQALIILFIASENGLVAKVRELTKGKKNA
ncbi:MAG: ABC transporter permease [Bdellovibrionales bacterium]